MEKLNTISNECLSSLLTKDFGLGKNLGGNDLWFSAESKSLGFKAETDGDVDVLGDRLAVAGRRFVLVLLDGFDSGATKGGGSRDDGNEMDGPFGVDHRIDNDVSGLEVVQVVQGGHSHDRPKEFRGHYRGVGPRKRGGFRDSSGRVNGRLR